MTSPQKDTDYDAVFKAGIAGALESHSRMANPGMDYDDMAKAGLADALTLERQRRGGFDPFEMGTICEHAAEAGHLHVLELCLGWAGSQAARAEYALAAATTGAQEGRAAVVRFVCTVLRECRDDYAKIMRAAACAGREHIVVMVNGWATARVAEQTRDEPERADEHAGEYAESLDKVAAKAAGSGFLSIVKLCVGWAQQADFSLNMEDAATAAARSGHTAVLEYCFSLNVDTWEPMRAAAQCGYAGIVKLCVKTHAQRQAALWQQDHALKFGRLMEAMDAKYQWAVDDAMAAAAARGFGHIVEALARAGASAKGHNGAMAAAAANRFPVLVRQCRAAGADNLLEAAELAADDEELRAEILGWVNGDKK